MEELDFLKHTLRDAYDLFCKEKVVVSEKASFDMVTNVDKGIERYFSEKMREAFPGDTLLGEEFSAGETLSRRTWILDPIDGTFNFASGSHLFGLQGAFWEEGAIRAGVIYLPGMGEIYEAEKGKGAFRNGERIRVSSRRVPESIVSFGDLPHARPGDAALQGKMMQKAYGAIARLRMYGSAAVDFAYLASGRTEGVVLLTQNKWDLMPGMILAQEAGALLYGVEGEAYDFASRGIFACSSRELFDAVAVKEKEC